MDYYAIKQFACHQTNYYTIISLCATKPWLAPVNSILVGLTLTVSIIIFPWALTGCQYKERGDNRIINMGCGRKGKYYDFRRLYRPLSLIVSFVLLTIKNLWISFLQNLTTIDVNEVEGWDMWVLFLMHLVTLLIKQIYSQKKENQKQSIYINETITLVYIYMLRIHHVRRRVNRQ